MKYLDYKENKMQGTEDFPMAIYHLEPDSPRYEMPYHWHPQQEIIRVLQGSFRLILDGEIHELSQGDIVYIQDGISHGGIPTDCIYECLVFDLKILQKFDNKSSEVIRKIQRQDFIIPAMCFNNNSYVTSISDLLFSSMHHPENNTELESIGALYMLFGFLIKNHLYTAGTSASMVNRTHSVKFKKALDYIESHYTENISLAEMASAAGMNEKYFCHFFREMTSKTPTSYLNYYRIECACEQLSIRLGTVTEIALNNGFNDISYFIKTFKRQKGVTPRQYISKKMQ